MSLVSGEVPGYLLRRRLSRKPIAASKGAKRLSRVVRSTGRPSCTTPVQCLLQSLLRQCLHQTGHIMCNACYLIVHDQSHSPVQPDLLAAVPPATFSQVRGQHSCQVRQAVRHPAAVQGFVSGSADTLGARHICNFHSEHRHCPSSDAGMTMARL